MNQQVDPTNLPVMAEAFGKDETLRRCEECGGLNFLIARDDLFGGHLREDGVLVLSKFYGEEHDITCRDCEKKYSFSDFKEVEDNW